MWSSAGETNLEHLVLAHIKLIKWHAAIDPECCYEKSYTKPQTAITRRISFIVLVCPPNKTLLSDLRVVFMNVRFAFSLVNTDISRSITLTPRAFRMHVISVWLMSLQTVLTLLERRQTIHEPM